MISSLSNQWAFVLLFIFLGATVGLDQSNAQDDQVKDEQRELSDMELIERVAFLQGELESIEVPKRDAAEKELISHGVRVLDYLEAADENTTSQAIERLWRIKHYLKAGMPLNDRFSSVKDFHRALFQIRKGDSQERVKELLGKPGGLHRIPAFNARSVRGKKRGVETRWYYCTHCIDGKIHREGTHRVCGVYFGKDGKVTQVNRDIDRTFSIILVKSFQSSKQSLIPEFSKNQVVELLKKLKSYSVSLDEDVLQKQLQQVITQNLNESQKDNAEKLTQQVWPTTKAALEKWVSGFNSIGDHLVLNRKVMTDDNPDRRLRITTLETYMRATRNTMCVLGNFQHCGAEPFIDGNWINVWLSVGRGLGISFEQGNIGKDESLDTAKQIFRIDLKPHGVDKQFNWELPVFGKFTVDKEIVCEVPKITSTKPDVEVTLKPEFQVTLTRTIKIPEGKGFNIETAGGEKDTVTGTYKIPEFKVRLKAELEDCYKFEKK